MKLIKYLNENLDDLRLDYIERDCQPYLRNLQNASPVDGLLLSGRKKQEAMFKGSIRKNRRPKDTPEEIQNLVDNMFEEELDIRPRSNSMFVIPTKHIAEDYGNVYFIFPIGKYRIVGHKHISDFYGDIVDTDEMQDITDDELPEGMGDEGEGEYGEDKKGEGYYRGEYFSEHSDEVIDEIVERNETDDMSRDEIDDMKDRIYKELEWIPEKSEEDFKRDFEIQKENNLRRLRDTISNYQVGNLFDALQYKNEIMLMGDGYYAVNFESYRSEVLQGLKNMGIKVNAYGRGM